MIKKLFSGFILLALSMTLSSCLTMSCNKKLVCISYDTEAQVIVINDYDEEIIDIRKNEKTTINITRFSSGTIEVSTPQVFNALDFGEYDHWFPMTHVIELKIYTDKIEYSSGGLHMRVVARNREEYDDL